MFFHAGSGAVRRRAALYGTGSGVKNREDGSALSLLASYRRPLWICHV